MIIDAHVHLYPEAIVGDPQAWAAQAGEARWAQMVAPRASGRSVQGWCDLDGLLREMDAAGVERAVLLGWYWERAENCAAQNRFYAECVRQHPDRLSGFATLHTAFGKTLRVELSRCRDAGLCGLGELSPPAQGYRYDDPVFEEALVFAAANGWPVNLHVTDPKSRAYVGRVETPLEDFLALARRHSDVSFILAHWGGRLPLSVTAAQAALLPKNIFYDTAASPLLYEKTIFSEFVARVGAERVLFGSDFPLLVYPKKQTLPEMRTFLEEARTSGLSEVEQRLLLGGNAARLLSKKKTEGESESALGS